MNILTRSIKWTLRAWPILILAIILFLHLKLISQFGFDLPKTNKFFTLVTQIIGGILIIYSINSNIGVLKNINLHDLISNYFKDFPLTKNKNIYTCTAPVECTDSCSMKATATRKPISIEKKIEYLQEQITELRTNLDDEVKILTNNIYKNTQQLQSKINKTNSALKTVENKIETMSFDGIKIQLFGILLMIYGAFTSYMT